MVVALGATEVLVKTDGCAVNLVWELAWLREKFGGSTYRALGHRALSGGKDREEGVEEEGKLHVDRFGVWRCFVVGEAVEVIAGVYRWW